MPSCLAHEVRETQADAHDAETADHHASPRPTEPARDDEPDAGQNDTNDDRYAPRNHGRDHTAAARVLRPEVGGYDCEQPTERPVGASTQAHASQTQMVLHTQAPARPQ